MLFEEQCLLQVGQGLLIQPMIKPGHGGQKGRRVLKAAVGAVVLPALAFCHQTHAARLHEKPHAACVRPRVAEMTGDVHDGSIGLGNDRHIRQIDEWRTNSLQTVLPQRD